MEDGSILSVWEFYAQTYDEAVPDWPGEIEFYQSLAQQAHEQDQGVLEIACGTGRVTLRLVQDGTQTVGLDLSPRMLEVARRKSQNLSSIRWVEADMRNFDLGETFGLVLIPGHAFLNLNLPQEQADCLNCIHKALIPGGLLVMHLDHMNNENTAWLGDLTGKLKGVFEPSSQAHHPETGQLVKESKAWWYEPFTQTATVVTAWETVDENGKVIDRRQGNPVRLHVMFRFEAEHALKAAGFSIQAVFGDFYRNPLNDDSPSMIWVAGKES